MDDLTAAADPCGADGGVPRPIRHVSRVLIYTDDPGEGGVAIYVSRLAVGLAGLGYSVAVAQSAARTPGLVASRPGIEHLWIPFDTRLDPQRNLTDTETAAQLLGRARADVVVFANCAPLSQVAATVAAADRGIPFVIVEGFVAKPGPLLPPQAWMLHYQRLLYERARAVVAVSQDNLALLRGHFGLHARKGEVIHNGRPADFFRPPDAAARLRIRSELGIPEDAVVSLTTARFAEVKGFGHQIAALRQLRNEPAWDRLRFIWAGEGPLREACLRELRDAGLADHVTVPGHVDDVAGLLDAADVFVLPSHCEGMPLSIMEAMAKGLAVAASGVSGIPEQMGSTGSLLPDPNVDAAATARALADTLAGWVADPAGRQACGAAARERAATLFREDRMLRQTASVIERAVLPAGEYAAPGLEMVRLDRHFPHRVPASPETLVWEHLRDDVPHTFFIDERAPGTGFLNRDESILLFNIARQFRGRRALEVGCWLGWSAAHLAAAGVVLDVIDPALSNPMIRQSVTASLESAGVLQRVTLHAAASPAAIDDLARQGGRWSLFFIDGNHEAPHPLFDTATAVEYATPDAAVVFHDLASPDVSQALDYLQARGWQVRLFHTAQIMGMAWRGDVVPPVHLADPAVAWHVPRHLRRLVSREELDALRR